MSTSDSLRLGMIGCGQVARWHAKALRQVPDFTLAACCDRTLDRAQTYANEYRVAAAYGDLHAMLAGTPLDAVIIASWPTVHAEQIAACLDAGVKSILCEKALTMTGAAAYDIWRRATAAGAVVLEGYSYRHHPRMAVLQDLVKKVGPIDTVHASFSALDPEHDFQRGAAPDPERNWRRQAERGGGVPFDFTCYCVSAANTLIRALPRRVQAMGEVSPHFGTIRRLYGLIAYDAPAVALIESSKSSMSQELTVCGQWGTVFVPAMWSTPDESSVVLRRMADWGVVRDEPHPAPAAKPFEEQLRHFAAVTRRAMTPVLPLSESAVNIYALAGLVESMQTGRAVEIALPEDLAAAWKADHS